MSGNFTGNFRRPRNVNLSGKPTTSTSQSGLRGKQSTVSPVTIARQERAARAAERKKLDAATSIQRTWRGRSSTQRQRDVWRERLDNLLQQVKGRELDHDTVLDILSLVQGILKMGRKAGAKSWNQRDVERLETVIATVLPDIKRHGELQSDAIRSCYLLGQFAEILIRAISSRVLPGRSHGPCLEILSHLASIHPINELSVIANDDYFTALAAATELSAPNGPLLEAVLAPLRRGPELQVYKAFGSRYLRTPNLVALLGDAGSRKLRQEVDLAQLELAFRKGDSAWDSIEAENKLWILSHILWIARHDSWKDHFSREQKYIALLSHLLSSVASELSQRMDIEDVMMGDAESDTEFSRSRKRRHNERRLPLPDFVKKETSLLVEQSAITGLINHIIPGNSDMKELAKFLLVLLLVFPSKKADVCIWLCLAETASGIPAVRYVWDAVKSSRVFADIQMGTRNAVNNLKYPPTNTAIPSEIIEDDWNVIYLFLEIYNFLLSVTDDKEFFEGEHESKKNRQLPLSDIKELAVFLRNLGFAMYFSFGEIMGEDKSKEHSGEIYFREQETKSTRAWEVKPFRDTATAVMRAIHARDSRSRFLPPDHWLMTDHLSMDIPSVVQEEEHQQQQLEADSDDESDDDVKDNVDREALAALDQHTRRVLELERMQRANRRRRKLNYLASIAPKLEILQNLPFFIPFPTRVEIFREFVSNDQKTRRHGYSDPDQWRNFLHRNQEGHDMMLRQHAVIRRGREFDDAYKHYWALGDRLKEPIQISFVDKFGQDEAGIDGGGVTKEFLTGVCGEAFTPDSEPLDPSSTNIVHNMFKANENNLLYPNPTSIDSMRYECSQRGMLSADTAEQIEDLLQRYEFAGRILGKCLYEGILVDVAFAPFFLLKWSQPSSASAVGINDLRDLDSVVYRSLMYLKEYDGDVEELGLTFSLDTEIAPGKIINRPLRKDGDRIAVTNQNRLEYIHLVSRYRLSGEQAVQTDAFLRGLTAIVKPSWLRMFNQNELQTLVGGDMKSNVDIEDLRKNTVYGGLYDDDHPTIKLFWEVMEEFDGEQRGRVLKFVTSVSRPPLLGFRVLKPKFSIRDSGSDDQRLCSASTCVNLLKLPRYKDKKTMKEKLSYSVNSNAGFDLS